MNDDTRKALCQGHAPRVREERRKRVRTTAAMSLLWAALLFSGATVIAEEGGTKDVLRYNRDDLNKVAKDREHPMSMLIADGFRDRATIQAIWAQVAGRYVENGQWQAAWDIQRALLDGYVRGLIPFDEKQVLKITADVLRLPEPFMRADDMEAKLLGLFDGQEKNVCACRTLGALLRALETAGGTSRSNALGDRLMRECPNAPLGVEAAKSMPADAAASEKAANELAGTRAGTAMRFRLAEILVAQGRRPEAVSAYEMCLGPDADPADETRALSGILDCCEQGGEYDKAAEWAARLLDRLAGEEAIALASRIAGFQLRLGRRDAFSGICVTTAEKYGTWLPARVAEFLLSQAQTAEGNGWLPEAAELYAACWCAIAEANDLRAGRLPPCKVEPSARIRFWRQALGLAEDVMSHEGMRALVEAEPGAREAACFHYMTAENAASKGEFAAAIDHARTLVSLCPDSSAATKLLSRIEAHLAVADVRGPGTGASDLRVEADAVPATVEDLFKLAEERKASGDFVGAVHALHLVAASHLDSDLAPRALYEAAMIQRDALNDPRGAGGSLDRLCVIYPDSELGITAWRLLNGMDTAR